MPPKGFDNNDNLIPVAIPSLPPPPPPNLPNSPPSQIDDATVKPDDSSSAIPIAPQEQLEMIMAASLRNLLRKAKKTPAERKMLAEIASSFNEIGDSITAIAESDEEGEEDPQSVQSLISLVVKAVEKVIPLPSLQLRSLVWAPEEDTDSQGSLAKQLLKQKEMKAAFDEVVKRCISAEEKCAASEAKCTSSEAKCITSDALNVALTEQLTTFAEAQLKTEAGTRAEVANEKGRKDSSIAELSAQLAGIYATQEELRAANVVLTKNTQATQEEWRAANAVLTENHQADMIALREELQADGVILRKELQIDLAAMREDLEDIAYEKETVVHELNGNIYFLNDAIENLHEVASSHNFAILCLQQDLKVCTL